MGTACRCHAATRAIGTCRRIIYLHAESTISATCNQNLSISEKGCSMMSTRFREVSGRGERSTLWVIDLSRCSSGSAADYQHSPTGKQCGSMSVAAPRHAGRASEGFRHGIIQLRSFCANGCIACGPSTNDQCLATREQCRRMCISPCRHISRGYKVAVLCKGKSLRSCRKNRQNSYRNDFGCRVYSHGIRLSYCPLSNQADLTLSASWRARRYPLLSQ